MIDIKFLRENPDVVRENNKKKFPGFKTIKNNMRLLQKCKETK